MSSRDMMLKTGERSITSSEYTHTYTGEISAAMDTQGKKKARFVEGKDIISNPSTDKLRLFGS